MIERLHEHMLDELKTNTRTDTVFILTAILLNFIAMGVNTIFAEGGSASDYTIFGILIALVIVVNVVAFTGLKRGKQTRYRLLKGMLKMYKDQNVAGYYDDSILEAYDMRYTLFTIVVIATGVVALLLPIILMVLP